MFNWKQQNDNKYHLVGLYPGQSGWAGTRKRHSLTHSLSLWLLSNAIN